MLLPKLSELAPEESTDGSTEALGLDAIADELASLLVPGIRERHQHPRFLTSIAVSLYLSGFFPDQEYASDQVSEPWQVFEWHVVEGLVRISDDRRSLSGLPGASKVRQAIESHLTLNARRYLKSPANNGFHGVYRGLARELAVEEANQLGLVGISLLQTWEAEQQLEGFYGGDSGPGYIRRQQLLDAIADGLKTASVSRKPTWQGWNFFHDHLHPQAIGRQEAKIIQTAIRSDTVGFRAEVYDFVSSKKGDELFDSSSGRSQLEKEFHQQLAIEGSSEIRPLLRAIAAYESFSRTLYNGFHACIRHLAASSTATSGFQLASLDEVVFAAKNLPSSYQRCLDLLEPYRLGVRFADSFQHFSLDQSPKDWLRTLIDHHKETQDRKLPVSKSHWFDEIYSDSYLIRAPYREMTKSTDDNHDGYVHPYRSRALWRFSKALKGGR